MSLGEVPSTLHLKMEYHMSKSEVVMLCADLMGARRCDKALQELDTAAVQKRVVRGII